MLLTAPKIQRLNYQLARELNALKYFIYLGKTCKKYFFDIFIEHLCIFISKIESKITKMINTTYVKVLLLNLVLI